MQNDTLATAKIDDFVLRKDSAAYFFVTRAVKQMFFVSLSVNFGILGLKMDFLRGILRRAIPVVAALGLFFVVAVLYFAPQFSGEVLPQHDVLQYGGMTADILENREAVGEDPQWTGGMFGGMPAYLINVEYPAQVVKLTIGRIIHTLKAPAGFLFFAMVAMWLMMIVVGVNPWVGIIAALSYGLSTYFLLIIGAGHVTKMWALVYAPLMMGGIYCTMRRDMWAGGVLTALGTSLEVGANHPQITYYFLLTAAIFWVSELIYSIRGGALRDFMRRTAVVAAAGIIGVMSNFSPLWYTMQHTPETMRGGSELAVAEDDNAAEGLDLEYATAWSYGRLESMNLLIPDFMGGDSGRAFSADGQVAEALSDYGLEQIAQQLPMYWGDQPYTAGPTYLGAVALFLAVLGVMLVDGRNRWWIVVASVVMLFLSWGNNMMWLTRAAFEWLPMYNKFRTVSMTLVVVEWTVPLLAAIALTKLWQGGIERKRLLRSVAWSAGVVGGVALLFAVAGGSLLDFGREDAGRMMTDEFGRMLAMSGYEEALRSGLHEELGWVTAEVMAAERCGVMSADAWRSVAFIALAAAFVAAFAWGKIRRGWLVAAVGVLLLADMVPVDMRYLSKDNFTSPRRQRVVKSPADEKILADESLGYRVLNLTVSPFNDATTSYFHRSVGGYHGAKLARYQDIIDRYLARGDERILDMLNTRYVILSRDSLVVRETTLGAAWFVDDVVYTSSAEDEIDMLDVVDLSRVAVIDERFEVGELHLGDGEIRLVEYRPNYLRYEYEADAPALAVFSEIYYNKGWSAYVDGEQMPYMCADYILRSMELPAGRHTVEWRFRAPAWRGVEAVTLISSIVVLGGCVAYLIVRVLRRRREIKVSRNEK